MTDLITKIETRNATVAVVGLGYVGLPLAVAFAEAGFRVVGIDVDERKVEAVNRGDSYVEDIPSERLAAVVRGPKSNGQSRTASSQRAYAETDAVDVGLRTTDSGPLTATTDYDTIHEVDVAIICVPTPLNKTKDPDVSYIVAATEAIAERLHEDMLVVLESTTYPGTTEDLVLPILHGTDGVEALERANGKRTQPFKRSNATGLEVGRDFYLAFSPERIDPGNKVWTVTNTPKVIGGVTPKCLEAATALYESAIEQVVPVSSPQAAEMVKLLENTFRAVNVALVNEVAIMCDRLDIDVWEVVEAAETKPFGFMPFYPGPGLGGHCLPVDPHFLAWKLKTLDYKARFIELADEVNFGMPEYVFRKITDALNEARKPVNGSRVLLLGVAYKANVGDLRESPARDIIRLLQAKGAEVTYNDPHVPTMQLDGTSMTSEPLTEAALQAADCVVITAAHDAYDWTWIVDNSRLVVDTRNATKSVRAGAGHVVTL